MDRLCMRGFAVKFFGGDNGRDGKHCLCVPLLGIKDCYMYEDLDLGFEKDTVVEGSSCRGLFHFHDYKGNSVICNITTRESRFLTPPSFKPPPCSANFIGCGFGYDAQSEDYKVLRMYVQHNARPLDGCVGEEYLGSESHTQLYSFKSNSWKEIETPAACMHSDGGVYLEKSGCFYWISLLDRVRGRHVLSFDFTEEEFSDFVLPPSITSSSTTSTGRSPGFMYTLVDHLGDLGVICYPRSSSGLQELLSPASSIQIWVLREMSWDKLYDVSPIDLSLHHVVRPLSLRGQFLFVEVVASGDRGQLVICDLSTKERKKFNVYDHRRSTRDRSCMGVYAYDAGLYRIPDATQMSMIGTVCERMVEFENEEEVGAGGRPTHGPWGA